MPMAIRMALKSLRMKNFKCYENYNLNFGDDDDGVFLIFGLFGPNGCGKTTILDAITLSMSSFASYSEKRIDVALSKYIRNYKMLSPSEQSCSDFIVEADFVSDIGDYTVAINRRGYIDGKEHPPQIKESLIRQCYRTRYDEELNLFQLRIDRWELFKELFEAVTGYSVEKVECPVSPFTLDDDELHNGMALLDQYVLNMKITKPNEIISDRECSKGEKKTIKNFTTLLNMDDIPSIILIDDVEMHVEIDRHMILLECIEKCFPDSQVIFTTHSPKIINSFDLLRMQDLTSRSSIANETWRRKLLRLLGKASFFHDEGHNLEVIKDTIRSLREDEEIDKTFVKHIVREALFTSLNQLIEQAEEA